MSTSKKLSIAYYVSAHGYGHGVRSCDIIRALNRLYPEIDIHIVTGLPREFLRNRINSDKNAIRLLSLDVGMVQKDSVRVDVAETLKRLERFCDRREGLISEETAFLKENGIRLVITDIPYIPIHAASQVDIPAVAIGNFGWDWIYSAFIERDSRWETVVERIRNDYSRAVLLLRLPFSERMSAFSKIEDIPLVASPGRDRRNSIADLMKCNPEKKWILLSFTTLDWRDRALDRVENLTDYEFFTVYPLEWRRRNIHTLHREAFSFPDIVASVDAVISKPGFGILSDCVINDKPLIYVDRTDFSEFAVLEAAVKQYLKYLHIPSKDLYAGELKQSIQNIWDRPDACRKLPHGGDVVAAHRIARFSGIM